MSAGQNVTAAGHTTTDERQVRPATGARALLATIEQALDELRAGRPVLVADSPDRENEVASA